MCNSQFLFWELKDEKFVRDDSSEPSGPNQIKGDSPHRARPHPGMLDLAHAHAEPRPRMRTQVLFWTSLAPNLVQLPHPVFGSTMQLSSLLYPKTPVPCLRDPPRARLPAGLPRLSPSPFHRHSRLRCSGTPSQTQALTTGRVTAWPSGRQSRDWHTGSFLHALQQESWKDGPFREGRGSSQLESEPAPNPLLSQPPTTELHWLLGTSTWTWGWKYLG